MFIVHVYAYVYLYLYIHLLQRVVDAVDAVVLHGQQEMQCVITVYYYYYYYHYYYHVYYHYVVALFAPEGRWVRARG